MKHLLLPAAFTVLFFVHSSAQLKLDKSLDLTGSGSDAKITGIKSVTAAEDAVSVEALQSGKLIFPAGVSGANDIALNFSPSFTATSLVAGTTISFKAASNNTGNVRLNVDGLGLKPLYKDVSTNLDPGDLQANQIITAVYDGNNFQLTSRTMVNNSGGTVTSVNTLAPLTGTITTSGAIGLTQTGDVLQGAGISVTNGTDKLPGTGDITITNTGVLSVGSSGVLTSTGGQNPTISLVQSGDILQGSGVSVTNGTDKLPGTTDVTITNTGVLSVGASGNITSTGGQNPSIGLVQTGDILAGTGISVTGGTDMLPGSSNVTILNTGVTSLAGTANQVNVSAGTGSVTLSTPQNIHTGASPTFAGATLTGLTASQAVYTDASKNLTTTTPTSGQLGYWTRSGTKLYNTATGDNVGIGVTNPGQKLEIAGNLKIGDNLSIEGTSDFRIYRNLASYSVNTSSSPGAFVINTTHPWNANCMFTLKVEGYFYDATAPFEMNIGAYMYTNSTWHNHGFTNIGSHKLSVRLARNISTNTIAVIIGNEASSYSYPKISVTSYKQMYNNINEAYADGWAISQVTSLSNYDFIANVPDVTTIPAGSGNYIQNGTSAQSANFNISGNGTFGGNITSIGDIVSNKNYGLGNVGVYSSTRYQNVWSMGASYRLLADGTGPDDLYGLAWTHTNVGGQSKAGLGHQLLVMENGVTRVALGTGIWMNGNLTFEHANPYINASSYFVAPGGAYFNSGVVYCNSAIRARGGIQDDDGGYLTLYGGSGAHTGTKVYNNSLYVDFNGDGYGAPYLSSNAGGVAISGNWTGGNGETDIWNGSPAGSNRGFKFWSYNGSQYLEIVRFNQSGSNISNGWTTFSDVRYKKNIAQLTGALARISEISAYQYDLKADKFKRFPFDNNRHIGFIAQEVEKVIPEIVETDEEGMKSIDYGRLTPVLVEAIKEQQDMINEIKSSVSDFGSVNVTASELWINFAPSFANMLEETQLPVVTVTSNKPGVRMYVAEKTAKGFKLVVESGIAQGLTVDYVAHAHAKQAAPAVANKTDWNELSEILPVPESVTKEVLPTTAPVDHPTKEAMEMKAKFGVEPPIIESVAAPE